MSTIYEKFAPAVQHHVKTVSGYVPAVKNGKTGKVVKFEWDQLLILAIDKGFK